MAPTFGVVLSVVVIAKNESHNLPRCLRSVQGLADDIVVVDSGSTDGTAELAKAGGARVFQREFTTYADQKNWAAAQASEPFVLSLDADEALSDDLRAELIRWKQQTPANAQAHAWSMPRRTNYCGSWIRHGGWYPDRKVRLWAAGAGSWKSSSPGGMLHEAWIPNPNVKVADLSGDLLHYSYYTTSDHHRQWSKFALLGAEDARREGRASGWWKPAFRWAFQFFKQFVVQSGWKDGRAGWEVARWSALSAYWKWRALRAAQSRPEKMRVGVVRTDALGDNVVTLPLAGALKEMLPGSEVVWICKPYAEALVQRSTMVDEVRVWTGEHPDDVMKGLDAVVFGFPEPELLRAAAQSKIPVRVATGRRWASLVWANCRVWRSRKSRPHHEAQQGLWLLHALDLPARWRYPEKEDWMRLTGLVPREAGDVPGDSELHDAVVLHPGNSGSANGWPLDRFEALSKELVRRGVRVVVTGTPSERPALDGWLSRMKDEPLFQDAVGAWTLSELLDALGQVSCVVASSTGPLHMASALGTPVVGLYRAEAPFWPERWAPLGESSVLSTRKLAPNGGLDVSVEHVLAEVMARRSQEDSRN